jgi:ABC-type sugar transport system substrate-binding protein
MKHSRSFGLKTVGLSAALCLATVGAGVGVASASSAPHAKKIKIALIQLQASPLTTQMDMGAQLAATQAGASFVSQGPAQVDPGAEVSAEQADDTAGINGLIVDSAAAPALFTQPDATAVKDGLSVVDIDGGDPSATDAPVLVAVAREGLGSLLAKQFATKLGTGAKGYIQPGICTPGLSVLTAVITGFAAEMKTLEPGITVKAALNTTNPTGTNYTAWAQIISENPTSLGFFGVCDQDAPNLLKIKQGQPKSKYLIGNVSGDSVAVLQGIKSGEVTAIIGQNGFVQGYVAAKLLLKHLVSGTKLKAGWLNSGGEVVNAADANAAIAVRQTTNPTTVYKYYKSYITAALAEESSPAPFAGETTSLAN